MKANTFLTVAMLALVGATTTRTEAFYRTYGRTYSQILFGPTKVDTINETNGTRIWRSNSTITSPGNYAAARASIDQGRHSAAVITQGTFANGVVDCQTEDELTFTKPGDGPIFVLFELVGRGLIRRPAPADVLQCVSTLAINGEVKAFYSDRWIGGSHTFEAPNQFVGEYGNGQKISIRHTSKFQVTGASGSSLYWAQSSPDFALEIRLMTPGATMSTSSNIKYKPRSTDGFLKPFPTVSAPKD